MGWAVSSNSLSADPGTRASYFSLLSLLISAALSSPRHLANWSDGIASPWRFPLRSFKQCLKDVCCSLGPAEALLIRSIPPLPKAGPERSALGNYLGVWVLAPVMGTGDGSITPWEEEVEAQGKMEKRNERRLDSWGPALKSLTFNLNRVA